MFNDEIERKNNFKTWLKKLFYSHRVNLPNPWLGSWDQDNLRKQNKINHEA
jgi:hypothetical protein